MEKIIMHAYCGEVSYGCCAMPTMEDIEGFRKAVIEEMLENGLPIKGPVLIAIPGGKA